MTKKQITFYTILIVGAILTIVGITHYELKFQGNTATSTPATSTPRIALPVVIQPKPPALPLTQIEDEYIEADEQYNSDGVLYAELLYPEEKKLKKNKKTADFITDNFDRIELEDTQLPEAEVITLYVRAKGKGDLKATLKMGDEDTEIITLVWTDEDLKKGWLTKWDSANGRWTRGQINNAYIEITADEDIKISSAHLYLEDQHSITDNFDSYNNGDLNGQGDWAGDVHFDVQGTVVKAGAKAIKVISSEDGFTGGVKKAFTGEADGTQYFYMRGDGSGGYAAVYFYDGASAPFKVEFRLANLVALNPTSGYDNLVEGFTFEQWYKIRVDWRASDDKIRYWVDDDMILDYQGSRWGVWDTIDVVELHSDNSGTLVDFYYDEFFEEEAPTDTCSCPDPPADWYISATDNCFLSTDCDLDDYGVYILNDEGPGSFNIIDDAVLAVSKLENTSTPINVEAGCKILFK